MKIYMFNSKKEFWNPVTRVYQKEPCSMTECDLLLTRSMAINKDDTVDVIRLLASDSEEVVLDILDQLDMTEEQIETVRDMNRDIMRSLNGNSDH